LSKDRSEDYPAYYRTLEVDPAASPHVIQAAYRALIKQLDPRMAGEDGQIAIKLNQAYEVLSDPAKRRDYDHTDLRGNSLGNYIIKDAIAEGGFGTTYLALHRISGEPVCIKHCHEVSAATKQVLIDEARAIWDLRHYSLPVMRDLLELEDDSLCLVMSYIPGPTIEQVIKKKGRLDAESVCWITDRVLNALKYLHYHGVVHGDIKPQNIIVQEETHTVVLVDFGLAMVKPKRTDSAKGYTPVFAPPEQLGGKVLLPESDFYSLGMTMLFMLCGSVEHATNLDIPSSTPKVLQDFIKELLRRDITQRPNWQKGDLQDTLRQVRKDAFGREFSSMKPLTKA
jgi:serine/threonine protein kinase